VTIRTTVATEGRLLDAYLGAAVFVRTVTHHYTGRLIAADETFMQLDAAAWIADDGRFADALADGVLSEVEPYPDSCLVALGAVLDVSPWLHDLPLEQK
jgi:hypothetical protein